MSDVRSLDLGATNKALHVSRGNTSYSEANADVDQVLVTIATIDVKHKVQLGVEIAVAAQTLAEFQIRGRFHASGSYHTLYSAAAEYISPAGLLLGASGDLTTIAAGTSGWFLMDVGAFESIQLWAACAADNGSTTVYAGVQ